LATPRLEFGLEAGFSTVMAAISRIHRSGPPGAWGFSGARARPSIQETTPRPLGQGQKRPGKSRAQGACARAAHDYSGRALDDRARKGPKALDQGPKGRMRTAWRAPSGRPFRGSGLAGGETYDVATEGVARVVEGRTAWKSVYTGNRIAGSNPAPSRQINSGSSIINQIR